ncbi:hypothetical protein [Litorivivens sp.]|uniref:hypothetical protein n=1 Tax=Litorivivens sp. TaxID=2020868 RepID=UPI003562994C
MAEIHSISIVHSDLEIVKKVTKLIISPFIFRNDFTVAYLIKTEPRRSVIELGYSALLTDHSAQLLIEETIHKVLGKKIQRRSNWAALEINVNDDKLLLPSECETKEEKEYGLTRVGSGCFRKGSPIENASRLYSDIHGKEKPVEGMPLCGIVVRAAYEQVFTIREIGNTLTLDSEEDVENFVEIFSSINDSLEFCVEIETMPKAEKERLKDILSEIIARLSS